MNYRIEKRRNHYVVLDRRGVVVRVLDTIREAEEEIERMEEEEE